MVRRRWLTSTICAFHLGFGLEVEAANFKRQTQALTILTIGTVIFGGALFQLDFTPAVPFSDWPDFVRFQICAALFMAATYLGLISSVNDILTRTTLITGNELVDNIISALTLEVVCASAILGFGLFIDPSPPPVPPLPEPLCTSPGAAIISASRSIPVSSLN